MSDEIFLARQPILDENGLTFGYELLYRAGATDDSAMVSDPDAATRIVVERTLLDWGIGRVVGQRFGFINAGPEIFSTGMYQALPAEGIVIEVRATAPVDDAMIEALRMARREGYHIALDDVRSFDTVAGSRVLDHASMVKVDVSVTPAHEIQQILRCGREVNANMKFIAERVETHVQFDDSVAHGFDLFQGYFFAKPQLLSRQSRPTNAVSALRLLAEIHKPDIDIDAIQELVGRDPTLAFRLLGVVNSCAFGLSRRVDSLRQAIVLLGIKQVRNLAMLLTLSATENVSIELIILGSTRARLAASLIGDEHFYDAAFTVGLLSVTDAVYGTSMEELMSDLPVAPEIKAALLDGSGPLARCLEIAIACERGHVGMLVGLVGSQLSVVLGLYAEAISWADSFRAEIGDQLSKVRVEGLVPLPPPPPGAIPSRSGLPVPTPG